MATHVLISVPNLNTSLVAALTYIRIGWAVVPLHWLDQGLCSCGDHDCKTRGKHPHPKFARNGVHCASLDVATVTKWYTDEPRLNIGIACGEKSGIVVLDVDPRNGGDDTLAKLVAQFGPLPDTATAITGGGGQHFIYKYTSGKNYKSPGKGLDVLSNGKLFVVAPSSHMSGRSYEWEGEFDPLAGFPLADPPTWMIRESTPRPKKMGNLSFLYSAGSGHIAPDRLADLRNVFESGKLDVDSYDVWRTVGMALHSTSAPEAFELWDTWSMTGRKYQEGVTQRKWDSFQAKKGLHVESIFALATTAGWENPRSIVETPVAIQRARAPSRKPVTFLHARDLLSAPAPIDWLIKGYLAKDILAAVIGASGGGKTFLILDWACCVATGTPWAGQPVAQGPVFVIAGEGVAGIRRRLRAWEIANNLSLMDAPLYVSTGAVLLNDEASAIAVRDECQQLSSVHGVAPVMVIVDTLARNFSGEENSATDVGVFINHLDKFLREVWGCCVLIVHHTGLSDTSQNRARGSSALRAALDVECLLKKVSDTQIALTTTKAKDWEPAKTLIAQLHAIELDWIDEDGVPLSSLSVSTRIESLLADMKRATLKQRDARKCLAELYELKKAALASDGISESGARVSVDDFRQELQLRLITTKGKTPERNQWRDLFNQLQQRKIVIVDGDCIYLAPDDS